MTVGQLRVHLAYVNDDAEVLVHAHARITAHDGYRDDGSSIFDTWDQDIYLSPTRAIPGNVTLPYDFETRDAAYTHYTAEENREWNNAICFFFTQRR